MGIFSALGQDFECREKGSDTAIEITRDEMIKIVHAVNFYAEHEADAFSAFRYRDITEKLDKLLD